MSDVKNTSRASNEKEVNFNKSSIAAKVTRDLFLTQMKWAVWFVGIVFLVYLIVPLFVTDVDAFNLHFLAFIFQSTKIFMLVIGILSCYAFLGYFVGNGITRKDYFIGSAASAVGVAVGIMALASVLQGVLHIVGMLTDYTPSTGHGDAISVESAWLIPFVVYSLSVVMYYVAGWLVSIGFYRYGGFGGFITIISALIYVMMTDMSWEGERSLQLFGFIRISLPELPLPLAMVTTVGLLVLGLWVLRKLTKRVPVKI